MATASTIHPPVDRLMGGQGVINGRPDNFAREALRDAGGGWPPIALALRGRPAGDGRASASTRGRGGRADGPRRSGRFDEPDLSERPVEPPGEPLAISGY